MSGLGNKRIMAENIKFFMEKNGKDRTTVCKDLKIPYTTFADWINAETYPRIDKIELLANYFNIEKSDLVEERTTSQWGNHEANLRYLEGKPELQSIYNEIVNRDDIYVLFDKTKDLDPKDVESVLMFVQTIRKQRGMDE